MRSFIKFIIGGILFLSLSPAFSQQQGLSTKLIYFADTSYLGSTDSVVVRIQNLDTSTYSGYINIYYTTDTVAFSPVLFCTINNIFLAGLDTLRTSTCNITFDTTYFHLANNIVVVWSSGNAKVAADSVWHTVYLKPSEAGVHEIDIASAFMIYPTAATDFIFIEPLQKNLLPKKIFIEDVTGRIVSVAAFDSKDQIRINTSELKSGIYFLDVLLPDKQRMISKFIKTD